MSIRARVVQNLALNTLIKNTATITSTDPTDVPILTASETVALHVVCEGTISSSNRVNVRSSPNAQGTVVDGIDVGDEAPVIGYVVGETPNVVYGWFQLLPSESGGERWVATDVVSGCESLSRAFSFNPADVLGSDLDDTWPAPEFTDIDDLRCVEGVSLEGARTDCAAQVYVAFYQAFIEQAGRSPQVRDLLAYFALTELSQDDTLAPPQLLDTLNINVNAGACLLTGTCNGYGLLSLLQGSDWWIQRGGASGADTNTIGDLVNQIISPDVQERISDIAGSSVNGLIQLDGETPIAWGNWYYGTTGYIEITTGVRPVMYCEIIRLTDDAGNYAYIFAIYSSEHRGPNDTNYRRDMVGIPEFDVADIGIDPNCPVVGNSQEN